MWMRPAAGAEDEMEMSEIEREDYPWAREQEGIGQSPLCMHV